MNDYQTIMAILDKAHIPYARDSLTPDFGADSLGLRIDAGNAITTEIVFGPDRNLIAIWAWE